MLQLQSDNFVPTERSKAEELQAEVDELKSQLEAEIALSQADSQRVVAEGDMLCGLEKTILQQVSSEIERRNKLLDMELEAAKKAVGIEL